MSRRATPKVSMPIVAVGASAGGLEAISKFLGAVAKDSDMAFLVVVHLDPHHESRLPEILQRHTSMPTTVMEDGAVVTPGTVMVCPPSRIPTVASRRIKLTETPGGGSPSLPIDALFRSVAAECGEQCAGVVLSGTGSDGTRGIAAIKGGGGLVLVQDDTTAAFPGMPQSAAATGLADAVGSPEELAGHLSAVGDHRPRLAPPKQDSPLPSELGQIVSLLRRQTGHDFAPYKATTLARRIERRMAVTRTATLAEYAAWMQQRSPDEAQALFGELLIGVTSFFRDREAFAALGRSALPELVASLDGSAKVRVWVPACSTGEEVYSLAMVLTESLDEVGSDVGIQIFGTDLNQNAIARARAGIYPAGIEADIDGRRLERFFQRDDHGFRVRRELREQVIFSVHDVLRDPPFSRLHLVSCRNLLIYLGAEAQKRLLPLLHYTLVDGGILFLGPSESIAGSAALFAPIVPKWKIYRRRDTTKRGDVDYVFPIGGRPSSAAARPVETPSAGPSPGQMTVLARDLLLRKATPTALVVSSEGRVVFIHGRTGRYLEPPEGRMSDNLVELAREGLRLELASALRHAAASKTTVSRAGIQVMVDGLETWVDLVVEPAEGPPPLSDAFVVILRPGTAGTAVGTGAAAADDGRIAELERELQRTRDGQLAVVEQLQASNEELKALNEEMQSSFEELQSTNEELESTKEEQQSLNEELVTVNSELQAKLDELSRIQDDMTNLLEGIRVASLFVNADLTIKRFTPEAAEVVNVIKGDVGRPLGHTVSRLRGRDLTQDAAGVLASLATLECEVQRDDGRWYLERVMPYRTIDNVIDGVVMTFTDIDVQKRFQAELDAARKVSDEVINLARDPIAVLDGDLRIVSANVAFQASFGDAGRACVGRPVDELAAFVDRSRELRDFVAAYQGCEEPTPSLAIDGVVGGDGGRPWRLTARALKVPPGNDLRILVAVVGNIQRIPGPLPEGGTAT